MAKDPGELLERTIGGLHQSLIDRLPPIGTHTPILDLGCGTGAWINRLRNLEFADLTGMDIDETQFKSPTGAFLPGDLNDPLSCTIIGKQEYGLITSIEVIEHLDNPGNLLRLIAWGLAPDGLAIITTPNIHSVLARLRFLLRGEIPSFDNKGDLTHIFPVSQVCFRRMLSKHDLFVKDLWGYPTRGSLIYSAGLRCLAGLISPFVPKGIPGDTLCFLICKDPNPIT